MLHYRLHHDPKSSHQQISTYVRNAKREPILDVGTAQGFLGQLVQQTGLTIDAVEPNPEWAECARPYYRDLQLSTIEDATLPDNTYRLVVCADV
ncbi:class I SAM-dependent methyltransferase, partial [bacterium]